MGQQAFSAFVGALAAAATATGTESWAVLQGGELRELNVNQVLASILDGFDATGPINLPAEVAVASATPNIGAAGSNFVNLTGTTAVTAFDTIAAGAWRVVRYSGIVALTHHATNLILPSGADLTTAAGDIGLWVSTGSGHWRCLFHHRAVDTALHALKADVQVFVATGTWTKPTGAKWVEVWACGAGGGAGGGVKQVAATATSGGGGGGGGSVNTARFNASDLGTTETVTVGSGGTSGAGGTVNGTQGSTGGVGGDSWFGTTPYCRAFGGGGGSGGQSAAASGGGGGGGLYGAAGSASGGTGSGGSNGAGAGGSGAVGTPGTTTAGGGGGGVSAAAGSAGGGGGPWGSGGGGAGGGISAANAVSAGGAGGRSMAVTTAPTGAIAGAAGTTPAALIAAMPGAGGPGGGSATGADGGAGANGQSPGGGAGGGAASQSGNGGAGGVGGVGRVVVTTFF